jgi:hypothetical protein
MLVRVPGPRELVPRVRRTFVCLLLAMAVVVCLSVGCSGSSPSEAVLQQVTAPTDIFTTLGVAGLGCSATPDRLSANGAAVARCGPIAGIPNSFLTIGMYPSALIAEQQYRRFCDAQGWSLYRSGENWRGVMDADGAGIPESVAHRIGNALETDVHGPCASPDRSLTP